MIEVPVETPVTVPPATEAWLLLLLHAPPVAGSVSTIAAPITTVEGPDIVPADGTSVTVIVFVAAVTPHPLVTV